MMEFTFLDSAGKVAFFRTDALDAQWAQEEMNLNCTFPYDPKKVIERGMRILFQDPATGDWQAYEIRSCVTIYSENTQQVTAEDIAISELTDIHNGKKLEINNQTAGSTLAKILANTGWAVGTNQSGSAKSSADIQRGSVWDGVNTIKSNWNVYIQPRVTVDSTGITGKYLDILKSSGVWRGVRIALDKNCSDPCVTYDDSNLYTALYGYGASKTTGTGAGRKTEEVTFKNVVWQKTDDHPAKPSGRTYLEWPEMTTLYGRNKKARFGYYQNTGIDDPNVLLQKTWEMLQTCAKPKISISGSVIDLKRLGYADEPLRLHDMAIIDLGGDPIYKQIIQLTVDLLDPSKNRVTIGDYIPNIIYINRKTEQYATGGSTGLCDISDAYSSSLSSYEFDYQREALERAEYDIGDIEFDISDLSTDLDTTISRVGSTEKKVSTIDKTLNIVKTETDKNGQIIKAAGMDVDASGVIIYATDVKNGIGANFKVQNDRITAEVEQRKNDIAVANTKITQTANKITLEASERKSADTKLSSKLTIASDEIKAEVKRAKAAEGTLTSSLKVNADAITAEVRRASSAEGTLDGKITVNADNITAEVTRAKGAEGDLSGRISVNADNITAEVTRAQTAEGDLSGRISINADNITAEVTRASGAEGDLSGRITVNSNKVSLVVTETSGGYAVNSASIVAGINGQTGSYVKISADTINLSGYVTTSDLRSTNAVIENLTTGATQAAKLWCTVLEATGFKIENNGRMTYLNHTITSHNAVNRNGDNIAVLGWAQ